MKKLLGILMTAALLLGSVSGASATDIKIKGYFDFHFGWYTGTSLHDNKDVGSDENFDAMQRLRFQIDFVASEQLSGTIQFEIGNISWGAGGGDTWYGSGNGGQGSGGAMGTDGVNVETKHMYIDWIVPETDLSVRMGLIPFALPFFANGANSGQAILDDDLAGIVLSYTFNEYVALNLAWLRPWNPFARSGEDYWNDNSRYHHDNIDLFALTLPLTFAEYGLEITPWGMFGFIGEVDDAYYAGVQDDGLGGYEYFDGYGSYGPIGGGLSNTGGLGDDGKAWWAGISFNVTYWDPFFFALDFMYGKYTSDNMAEDFYGDPADLDNDRDGWAASAKFGYKFEEVTPTLFGWYGSGADEDGYDGLMPTLSPDWGFTSFGWSNNFSIQREGVINGNNITGTWGIGIGLEDIKLIDKMTNALRVAYFRGTSDDTDGRAAFIGRSNPALWGGYLYTSDDWGVEVNLDTSYEIMEGLTLYNQIGYIHVDIDDYNNVDNDTDDAWQFAVGFRYAF